MTSAIEGVCDIGMASRDLKDSELEAGLTPTVIAMDGIAVVVNNESPVTELTSENVKTSLPVRLPTGQTFSNSRNVRQGS